MLGFGLSLVSLPLNMNIKPSSDSDAKEYLGSIHAKKFAQNCYFTGLSYMKIIPVSAYMEFLQKPFDLYTECTRLELSHLLNFMSWLRYLGLYIMSSIDIKDRKASKRQVKRAIILAKVRENNFCSLHSNNTRIAGAQILR